MKKGLWILLLIVIAAGYYLYQDPKLRNQIMGKVHQVAPELNQTTLYKWQDEKGQWQVTDRPPQGRPYQAISAEDQTNVLPQQAFTGKKSDKR